MKVWITWARRIAVLPIVLYQKTLSPDHGPFSALHPHGYCRFTPSCSEYTKQAIIQKGIFVGIGKGIWRIVRCNPWNKGGHDPV